MERFRYSLPRLDFEEGKPGTFDMKLDFLRKSYNGNTALTKYGMYLLRVNKKKKKNYLNY